MMNSLRKSIQSKRRSLSSKKQQLAAFALLSQFKANQQVQKASHIALYFSVKGEIDTKGLIEYCWQQNKAVYLPVLHPFSKGHLLFLRYQPSTQMVTNAFGIPEPKLALPSVIPANKLDLIFAPLVAFDKKGNRLGMGGGYYDRLFSYATKPKRLGLAHGCQQVEKLDINPWDIALEQVLTPSKTFVF